jgi:galactofuranose transport system substrate-binding protein
MLTASLCRLALGAALVACLASCGGAAPNSPEAPGGSPGAKKTYRELVVGFAQIGAESEWRTANTRSIQDTAAKLGVELKFSDAQQMQEKQISAIRSFIAQRVDVIGVSPLFEQGWEPVFREAKAAGIPLILLDRHAQVPDDLYAAFIGSDFRLEGANACHEMARLLQKAGKIVELEGTAGSAPTDDRKAAFHECLRGYPDMKVIDGAPGDFIRAKGREVMETLLKAHGQEIDAVFSHNDDMALGAIQAIEAYGLKPGVDIKIVSVDAVRSAFEAMIAGKLNVTVECNPILGAQFFETALRLANGEPVDKWVKSREGIFRQETALEDLAGRQY